MPLTTIQDYNVSNNVMPPGTIIQHIASAPFSGWLLCDGQEASRTGQASLFAMMPVNTSTYTFSTTTLTWNSHPLLTGDTCQFTSSVTLPTGVVLNTVYYVRYLTSNTFQIHSSLANAFANTSAISLSAGSGTHTIISYLFGNGNGSSTFNVPNFSGLVPRGAGTTPTSYYTQSATVRLGQRTDDAIQGHVHNIGSGQTFFTTGSGGSLPGGGSVGSAGLSATASSAVSDGTNGTPRTANETRVKSIGVNFFIKT